MTNDADTDEALAGRLVEVERWLPVIGYEGSYEVSNLGRVRSVDRMVAHNTMGRQPALGRILTPIKRADGYLQVGLRRGRHDRRFLRVHRLVAESFIPNPDGKPAVNHLDNDPSNPRWDNLEWCTQQENLTHAERRGRMRRDNRSGKRSPNAGLSDEQVREIRAKYEAGATSWEALGRQFGISKRAIGRLLNRESYADVQ